LALRIFKLLLKLDNLSLELEMLEIGGELVTREPLGVSSMGVVLPLEPLTFNGMISTSSIALDITSPSG
jgi:hypothetical protein